MTISTFGEQEVQITSVYFRTRQGAQHVESYPRRMVVDGREVNFVEQGMRYLVQKGQELVSLFDVSDGQTEYRLRLDQSDHWTLIGMRAGV